MLYVGGSFCSIGANGNVRNLAGWNGTDWNYFVDFNVPGTYSSPSTPDYYVINVVVSAPNGIVYTLLIYNSILYVGGFFCSLSDPHVLANNVVAFDTRSLAQQGAGWFADVGTPWMVRQLQGSGNAESSSRSIATGGAEVYALTVTSNGRILAAGGANRLE
jgi:hypothetical protein